MSSQRLLGLTVVLTRRPEDNTALAHELRAVGAETIELPSVRTEALAEARDLADAIAALCADDLLVLTSRAGADAVASVMPAMGLACEVAAVGEATAQRAASLGMRVRQLASRADGVTLGREIALPRGHVLLARSDQADRDLPATLEARGAIVREVIAYRTVASVDGDPLAVRRAIEKGRVAIVVASPSAVDALVTSVGRRSLRRATFVAIGPRTADRVRERVGRIPVEADGTSVAALLAAIPAPAAELVAR